MGGAPFVTLSGLIGPCQPDGGRSRSAASRFHRPAARSALRCAGCPPSDVVGEVMGCTAGDWGSGSLALTLSRGSCGSLSYTSSDNPAFPTCSCPRWLSPRGELGDPRSSLLI